MKSYRKELRFEVPGRRTFINITTDVQSCIDESGIKEALIRKTVPFNREGAHYRF